MGVETISSSATDLELHGDIALINRKKVGTNVDTQTILSDYYGIDRYNGVPLSGPLSFDDFRGTSMHTASFIPSVRVNRNSTYSTTASSIIADGPDETDSIRHMYAIGFGASNSNFQYPESGTTDLAPASFGSIDYDTGLFPGNESAKLVGLWVYHQNHEDENQLNPGVYNLVLQWDGGSTNTSAASFSRLDMRIQSGNTSQYIGTFYRSQSTTFTSVPGSSGCHMWVWEDENNTGFATSGQNTTYEPDAIHNNFLSARSSNSRIYIKFS